MWWIKVPSHGSPRGPEISILACAVQLGSPKTFAVVSAMGSHPSSPIKVTDLILNMISKAARKDDGFLTDLNALEEKHMTTANELLGADTREAKAELSEFTSQLLSDISDLKSMLKAISIGVTMYPPESATVA